MVRITDGRNTLVVPTSAYKEQFENNGWQMLAKKKTDSIVKKIPENNIEEKENIEVEKPISNNTNKKKKK